MRTVVLVLREAAASARSQPVTSLLTLIMVAGMCVAALLTTGRTVAAEAAVLGELDAVGTRNVVVRADADAGLTVAIVDQLRRVAAVEQVTGFGPINDARNTSIPDGVPVPIRYVYGDLSEDVLRSPALLGTAAASPSAVERLGLIDGTGSITSTAGAEYTVNATFDVPLHLAFLDPVVLIGSPEPGMGAEAAAPLSLLVVQADQPEHVDAVTAVVIGLLADADPQTVSIETSQQIANIRAAISGELGSYSRTTVLGILGVSAVLVAVNLFGLVTLRRKDFGRRRALGATQPLIITLLLSQVGMLAIAGAALGTAGTIGWLVFSDQPIPAPNFSAAVAVAAILTAMVAALAPATIAARRDPLHELRVP